MNELWQLRYDGVTKPLAEWGIADDFEKSATNQARATVTLRTIEDFDAGATQLPFKIKESNLKSKNGKGTVYFDVKKGRLEKSEQKIELEGKMTIEIAGMTTEVTLNQTQETNINTSDKPQITKPTS